MKQEEIAHARMRAMAQILMDKEKGQSAFEDYMKSAFPWIEGSKSKDKEAQVRRLFDEVKRGALSIQPLWQSPVKSRLKAKIVMDSAVLTAEQRKSGDALYKKMGKVIPK